MSKFPKTNPTRLELKQSQHITKEWNYMAEKIPITLATEILENTKGKQKTRLWGKNPTHLKNSLAKIKVAAMVGIYRPLSWNFGPTPKRKKKKKMQLQVRSRNYLQPSCLERKIKILKILKLSHRTKAHLSNSSEGKCKCILLNINSNQTSEVC